MHDDSRTRIEAQAAPSGDGSDPDALLVLDGVSFLRAGRPILDGISFSVRRGEYVALMGPNGSGKTTLVRHLNGLLRPTAGAVRVRGLSTDDPDALAEIRRAVGLVFQDPDDQMVAVTVEDEIAFGLENLRWDRARMIARVAEALDRFHLAPMRDRATTSLSGGEQQRVAIAAVWATDPAVLVLDEPTSQLDRPSAAELLDLLDAIAGDRVPFAARSTVIHVTQDVGEARRAGRVIVMDGGRIALDGPPDDVLADTGRLRALGLVRDTSVRPRSSPIGESGAAPVLAAEGIHHARRDGPVERAVLRGVRASVPAGSVLAIVGKSGSGKSTFAWHLNRLLEPGAGIVRLLGRDARDYPLTEVRRKVGFTFQRVELQLFEITVADDVAFGLVQQGVPLPEARARAARMLDELGMPAERYANRRPASLSMGEQRRVALAGVLVLEPAALVLDEPTSGLDARGVDLLADQIYRLRDAGRAIAVITHDLAFARRIADRVLVLDDGRGTDTDRVADALDALESLWKERS